MMENQRKVIVYIAASLDGYIAGPNDDMAFLSLVNDEGQDYGYFGFIESIDTVIMGRRTYDWVMTQVEEFPHANLDSYIITRTAKPAIGKIRFYDGSLRTLVEDLKSRPGKNIFVDGGAEVVHTMLQENLIDELIVSFIPVLLGEGVRLFKDGRQQQKLNFQGSKSYPKGLVQVHYSLDFS